MANRVVSSATIKTIVSNGQPVLVKYATETSSWKRPYLSADTQEKFVKAIEKDSHHDVSYSLVYL